MFATTAFKRGAVVRVTLQNFLTYDDVTVLPGARLNLIVGPNGSGKSSIVAALVLGLGGTPEMLGQAGKVDRYIKAGADTALIELELFDEDGNQVISRRIHRGGRESTWKHGDDVVSHEDVLGVAAKLNIAVGNLCQVLPQMKVQDFAKLDARGLLEGTEKAVGYKGMYKDHQRLKDGDQEARKITEDIKEYVVRIKEYTENLERLQVVVDNQKAREKLVEEVQRLTARKMWFKYEAASQQFQERAREAREAKAVLQEHERDLMCLENTLSSAKRKETALKKKSETSSNNLREENERLTRLRAQVRQAGETILRLKQEHNSKAVKEKERQERALELKQKLEYARKQLDECEEADPALDDEIRNCDGEIRGLSGRETSEQATLDARSKDHEQLQGRVNGLQSELKRVRSDGGQRLQILRGRDRDLYKAVLWLRENATRFKGTVHEPMILLLDVFDKRFAKYVETSIPWGDLFAFTCENREDMKEFLQQTRNRQGLRISCVLSDPAVPRDEPVGLAARDRELGFTHTVGDLFSAPDAVRRYLQRVSNIPVASVDKEAEERIVVATSGKSWLTRFLVGDTSCTSGRSRYSSEPWVTSSNISAPSQFLMCPTDQSRELELEREIAEAKVRRDELKEKVDAVRQEVDRLATSLETQRRRRKALTARRDQRCNLEGLHRAAERSLQKCQQQKFDVAKHAAETDASVRAELEKLAGHHDRLLAACQKRQGQELRLNVTRVQHDLAQRRRTEATNALAEAKNGLADERRTVEEKEGLAQEERLKAKQLRCSALKLMGLQDDDALEARLVRLFRPLPDSLQAVEAEIHEKNARAGLIAYDQDAVERHESLMSDRGRLQEAVTELEQSREAIGKGLASVRQRWETQLEEIVTKVNIHFSKSFQKMGCVGEVGLLRPDDGRAAGFGISILVKFRAAEQLLQLSSMHHSGGERSVATMLFFIALQKLGDANVPFHCVDEINQGMDALNERRTLELVVETACHEDGAQYFLVTPKLLPRVSYPSSGITVLCVFNSPTMLPHTQWDVEAFCRRIEQKRYVGGT
ncbi:structural maintenance of chromosomes protein 5-like [Pollicipes pollicipes]|uniref:structural maintenance of chromosomes protein 5-like n=1 Tax=Pollicipes pollicipes TaxID=41117 RepID=UPI001884A1E7|nr:structural maintenance of chromosomes protein 5-like [Pollicipes pollicipes]XP_037075660.1 structural maintenance of chromosomes protein 5-like [Pollicipes pollicipes]XP_037075661.1 structural maintenance of chromosomes protein 5-like [Pollicipes pollicipes]XP_037075662.1 structural maintenance of chromosomes protein 5-like [Pollicipes pollicipes]XP_037075663.1 structural maintenance of chromosomes protein 5-like [Pollicipes pollicipes]XP_037075664.1 structural maintenance of chromosomes pr